jgi:preprotein translocase subunit SecA
MYRLGRPVLVGTTTIEKSELLAALLSQYKIPYRLLNARPENVESESEIVAQAGCKNAVTIATNMAGRGTDIMLGGNAESLTMSTISDLIESTSSNNSIVSNDKIIEIFGLDAKKSLLNFKEDYKNLIRNLIEDEKANRDVSSNSIFQVYKKIFQEKTELVRNNKIDVLNLGGLHIIGTERHESRRIDNQLRGRAGRQGNPGSSRFFLSLEDKLLRLFGGDQVLGIMQNIGFQDKTPIQSPLLSQSLESAQKKVEAYYFDIRKQLFEYDQALTMQRNGVYQERKRILQKDNVRDWVLEYGEQSLYDLIKCSKEFETEQGIKNINLKLQELMGTPFRIFRGSEAAKINSLFTFLQHQFQISYESKEMEIESIESGLMRALERSFLLQQVDFGWKDHLQKISFLRDSIKWRAYGQKDPLTEYKKEAFNFFAVMLTKTRHRVVYYILRSKILLDR